MSSRLACFLSTGSTGLLDDVIKTTTSTVGCPKLGFKDTIIGNFFISDPGSFIQFDETMTVNEESDFWCSMGNVFP